MERPVKLTSRWVLWQDKWEQTSGGQNTQALVDLGEADNARSFWQMFQSHPVDKLQTSVNLHVFRSGVKPEWEDPANASGGHFRFVALQNSGRLWYNLVATAIGGQFTLTSCVVGVGFANKSSAKKVVSLWLDTTDAAAVATFQKELAPLVGECFAQPFKFIAHRDLRQSGFRAVQSVWHRRTKSAPLAAHHPTASVVVSAVVEDSDDDDQGTATQPLPTHQPVAEPSLGLASPLSGSEKTEDSLGSGSLKRRHAPGPLDMAHLPTNGDERDSGHQRSKSEGVSKDIVPNTMQLRNNNNTNNSNSTSAGSAQNPLSHGQQAQQARHLSPAAGPQRPSPSKSGAKSPATSTVDFNWNDTEVTTSGSGVFPSTAKVPTPMKEWADQWSPSLLHSALQTRAPLLPAECSSTKTSPGAATTEVKSTAQLLQMAHAMEEASAASATPGAAGTTPPRAATSADHPLLRAHPIATGGAGSPSPFHGADHGAHGLQLQQPSPNPPHFSPGSIPPSPPHETGLAQSPMPQPAISAPQGGFVHHQHLQRAAVYGSMETPQLPPSADLPSYVIVRQPVVHPQQSAHHPQHATQPAESPAQPGRRAPPSGGAGAGGGRAAANAPHRGGATPPPQAASTHGGQPQPPTGAENGSTPPPASGSAEERRAAQQTKSDAPAFVLNGWKYPAGLNRKERRRIMFSEEIVPAEYPGAVFLGAGVPDGPVVE